MVSVVKRLRPIYVAAFFQGLVFWYVVDKLLATEVGLSATLLSVILAAQSLMSVLLEIPSGILADRWSRKGVLILSNLFLGVASLVGAVAAEPWHYLVVALFWGAFDAMYSGTYEAIVYDVLVEEEGDGKNFERMFGKIGRFDGLALMIGSIAGAGMARIGDVHTPFIATCVAVAVGMYALSLMREPKTHKAEVDTTHLLDHVRETFRSVVRSRLLILLFITNMLLGSILRIMWEYNQLWYINLGLPIILFGIAYTLVFLALTIREKFVSIFKTDRFKLLVILLIAALFSTIFLMIHNAFIAAVGIVITMLLLLSGELVLTVLQQDRLPSRVRAGATSVLSSTINLLFIPTGIIFGALIDAITITKASLFIFALLTFAVIFAYMSYQSRDLPSSV